MWPHVVLVRPEDGRGAQLGPEEILLDQGQGVGSSESASKCLLMRLSIVGVTDAIHIAV